MSRTFITLAAVNGMLAVGFGAFGAHALKARLDDYAMGVFTTATQYHFYHSLALLAVGVLAISFPASSALRTSGIAFLLGIVVFSGSLYLLSLTGARWLGAVTPLGGVAFLVGWACLAVAGWRLPTSP